MFKGFIKKFQNQLGKKNQESDAFTFSFGDLELVEVNGKKRKCRIIDEELSKELHQIYCQGKSDRIPQIKSIVFNFYHKDSIFLNLPKDPIYKYWLEINKEDLRKQKISWDGTLSIGNSFTSSRPLNNISDYIPSIEKYAQKAHQTTQARTSALSQINSALQNNKIDLEELGSEYFFLRDDCLCNGDPLPPKEEAKYHQTHLNKCLWRPDRINSFKDKLLALIQQKTTEFNTYKSQVIQQIIQKATSQGLSETELNNNRSGWQDTLRSLTNREKVTNYQTNYLEKDIKNLVAAKKKSGEERQQAEAKAKEQAKQEEERLKKEQEDQAKKEAQTKQKQAEEQAKQQELEQKRSSFVAEITQALNQEPQLTNNELSPQYQNWEEQVNQLTDLPAITNLQARILVDIPARRQDKITAQKVKENLNKTKTGTKEEKKQAWENLEKQETEKSYQENKEEVEQLKKAKATENPQEYSQEAQTRIAKKLKVNGIKENELNDESKKEWQKLKNGEIQDPDQLVAAETKIKQDIYQKAAEKKITNLTSQVNKLLKSKDQAQIATVKKLLLEFISSGNVYHTASQKQAAESLLSKLENYSTTNNKHPNSSTNSPTSPWKLVVPLLLIGTCLTILLILRKKRVGKRRK